MLSLRLAHRLDEQQCKDQAGFRKGFSTVDHLLCTTLLIERCAEWDVDLWLGLVDFEKAFDSIEFDAMWSVLYSQGVDAEYVDLLKVLYSSQKAAVLAGAKSRDF